MQLKEAITKSLKGFAAESLRSLGPVATVEQILQSMKGKYGIAASYDSLMRDFYALVQEESEKIPQFATKIEIELASIKWRFPNRFLGNAEFTVLGDRLFFGLKKQIRDSIRFRFSDPTISYSELLRFAREAEVDTGGTDSGSKRKSGTTDRTKAKVSSAVVVDSDQVNSTDFDKLKSLVCKMEDENRKTQNLMKNIQDVLSQIQGNQWGGPRGRGRGNGRGRGGGRGYDG